MNKTLREKAAEKVAAMQAMITLAKGEGRGLTAEEKVKFEALKAERESLEALAAQEDEVAKLAAAVDAPRPTVAGRDVGVGIAGRAAEAKREFESMGEFLATALRSPNDQRLVYRESTLQAEQSMGDLAKGGFAIPQRFLPDVKKIDPMGAIIWPRAQAIPADPAHPDAEVTFPLLNQTSTKGNQGGISMAMIEEGGTITASDAALLEGTLKPREAAGIVTLSNKVLRNLALLGVLLEGLFREALDNLKEARALTGTGVNGPLGIIVSGGTVAVNRAVALQISVADTRKMVKSHRAGPGSIWIASLNAYEQIAALENASGKSVFQSSLSEGIPDRLHGFPIFWSTRNPVLGTKGDLMLVDLSKYLTLDGLAPMVAFSEHSQFATAKTQMRVMASFDGKPQLTSPLTYEIDSTKTFSPFVVLDVP